MAGYIDDLIKDEQEAPVQETKAAVEPAALAEPLPSGPTGNGGDARKTLYGDEFMNRYGRR